jgi:hypothetical protein
VDAVPPGSWDSADGVPPRVLRRWGAALIGLAVVLATAAALSGAAAGG